MSPPSFLVVFAVIVPLIQCHFTFVRVALNNQWQHPTQFIRNKTTPFREECSPGGNANYERLYNFPTYNTCDAPASQRCGRDHMTHAGDTDVLKVRPGDSLEFAHQRYEPEDWKDEQWYNCANGRGSCSPGWRKDGGVWMDFNHPGPVVFHLSKVPNGQDVRAYDGTGEWVKIYTIGLEYRKDDPKPVFWKAYNREQQPPPIVVKLPSQTPAGQYLLRIDYIWPGLHYPPYTNESEAQLYPSCMQIEVASDNIGSLPKGVMIPEVLTIKSPGMLTSGDMYNEKKVDEGYEYPGGPLWDGEKLVVDKPEL